MNLGIEDAATLAYMIDQGTTSGYSAARHPVGRHVLGVTDQQTRLMTSQSLVPRLLRRYIFPLIASIARHPVSRPAGDGRSLGTAPGMARSPLTK